jgi:hypothetical protein
MSSETVDIINVNIKKGEEEATSSSNTINDEMLNTEENLNEVKEEEEETVNYNLSNLKSLLSQQDLLKKHLSELKKNSIDNIYNENKEFLDYFHEKYDTNIYGDNSSDNELKKLQKKKYTYLNSTESIEDYNRPLLNVSKAYDDKKLKEKEENEQKYRTLSYGLSNDSSEDNIDPKEYLKKNIFNVLMPGIEELLLNIKKNEEGQGKEIKDPINWLANYFKNNNPYKNKNE